MLTRAHHIFPYVRPSLPPFKPFLHHRHHHLLLLLLFLLLLFLLLLSLPSLVVLGDWVHRIFDQRLGDGWCGGGFMLVQLMLYASGMKAAFVVCCLVYAARRFIQ